MRLLTENPKGQRAAALQDLAAYQGSGHAAAGSWSAATLRRLAKNSNAAALPVEAVYDRFSHNASPVERLSLLERGRDAALRRPRPRRAGGTNARRALENSELSPAGRGTGGAGCHPYRTANGPAVVDRCYSGRRAERAFTMVEIALSLAVVAFALVAIIGVLPTGMTVQKDNREDIIISQEGRFWIEAIKGGARGVDDLPYYVEEITVTNNGVRLFNIVNNFANPLPSRDIVALLGLPRSNPNATNDAAVARVRAITGAASEKGTNNLAPFRYQLRAEISPVIALPPGLAQNNPDVQAFNDAMSRNLWDIRLVLRWPVVERGNGWYVGNNRKTFRARVAGTTALETNLSSQLPPNLRLRTFVPNRFNG
jgi:hypothetical protein